MSTVEPASTPPDGAPRAWTVPAVPWERLPLLFHVARRPLAVGTVVDLTVPAPDDGRGSPEALAALLAGGGFTPVDSPRTTGDGTLRARVVRDRTLADTVGPGMRILICGVNPSPYSADAGVGYARPGNRFWPAALAAGLVQADRDPVAALAHGVGMTDFAKRPTSTAAEVRPDEYAAGFARVTGLVEWLQPRVVCFVGLSGWRTVVDRRAVAGFQPATVGGRPAYVMPSTSGLNARTPLDELARHLAAAADRGSPAGGPRGPGPARRPLSAGRAAGGSGRPRAGRRRTGR
ncbi:MAG TPA: mismatch-specific DNA-glycosylase [Acidimicrobiales bacterium]|nr:mismatch-specific DNA-glycosylase [Acidimicrobiales bacterium]